jgi:hypothetical protein
VNGDGYADILVGATWYTPGSARGRAYLFYGNGSGNALSGEYALATAVPNATFTGGADNNYAGCSVASAGDVNDDGYDDILVGAESFGSNPGWAYLYYGNGSANPLRGNYDLNSTANATFTGAGGSRAGHSVAGAGDVNADGYDDFLIGAYTYNSNQGQAYLFYGNGSANLLRGEYALGTTTANATFTGSSNSRAGYSVSGAGDVNGDGYADILVSAVWVTNQGQTYLFYGNGSANLLRGEYTLDTGTANATFSGTGSDQAGSAISGAGDVNGDGYADILIGAKGYSNQGRVYFYYGNGIASPLRGEYAPLNATANATFTGTAMSNAGSAVAGAGDVNGDGYADILVGAYMDDTGAFNAGRAFLFYGSGIYPARIVDLAARRVTPSSVNLTWTAPGDDAWAGTVAAYVLKASTSSINTTNWTFASHVVFRPVSGAPFSTESFDFTGLAPSTTYFFAIKAVDAKGFESPLSNTPQATTLDGTAPEITPPADVTYTEDDAGAHFISWSITDPSTSNPTYTIRVNYGTASSPASWISGTPITYNIAGWAAGVYYIEVTVTDGYGGTATDVVVVKVQTKGTGTEPGLDWGLILAAGQAPVLTIALIVLWRKAREGHAHPSRQRPQGNAK